MFWNLFAALNLSASHLSTSSRKHHENRYFTFTKRVNLHSRELLIYIHENCKHGHQQENELCFIFAEVGNLAWFNVVFLSDCEMHLYTGPQAKR